MEVVQPDRVSFQVVGKPAPAGSKRGFVVGGRVVLTDASKRTKPWQALVQSAALEAMGDNPPFEGPLEVTFAFQTPRPKSHFTPKGALSSTGRAKAYPTKAPDLLKLARAVEDALSGVCYQDDSQIVREHLAKTYGPRDSVFIVIRRIV